MTARLHTVGTPERPLTPSSSAVLVVCGAVSYSYCSGR